MDGLELQAQLVKANYSLPIVFISAHANVTEAAAAMKKGAIDFLSKPIDSDVLLRAIAESLERDRENRRTLAVRVSVQKRLAELSPREYEVMTYVIAGLLNKQIAYELGIAEETVKIHRGRIMRKMDAESVAELVRMTVLIGIKPAKVGQA